jgi:hypothetical protein
VVCGPGSRQEIQETAVLLTSVEINAEQKPFASDSESSNSPIGVCGTRLQRGDSSVL